MGSGVGIEKIAKENKENYAYASRAHTSNDKEKDNWIAQKQNLGKGDTRPSQTIASTEKGG